MADSKTIERFIELRAKGLSFDKIAKDLGKAKQTLIDWSKTYQEEIANLKALELETLYEKYYLQKEARLKTFGEMLNKIKAEIETRDLSDVPTAKLLDLLLTYDRQAKEELIEPVFSSSEEILEEQADRDLLEDLTATQPRKLKVA